jgi:hypothetical protein
MEPAPSTASPKGMRVLLRNLQTGLLYAGPGQWTENYAEARGFETMNGAIDFVSQAKLAAMQVLMRFENPEYEIPLTIVGLG